MRMTAVMIARRLASCAVAVIFAMTALPAGAGSPRAATIDWLEPTGGAYPRLIPGHELWIKVSLERQRVYIMSGEACVYTMIASTGLDSPADDRTPEGTFHVQKERGLSFYNGREREGARYWVSWLNHGEYLFHSVPTDKSGNIISEEAKKLGIKASHGCIRLSLADAKWIYEHVKVGTRVVIGRT
jgi:lipoprotein-anchoring transpeptidase ErfK/SrfK